MRGMIYVVPMMVLLSACSHKPYGRLCPGEVSTLSGQVTGQSQAWVFDEIQRFTVTDHGTTMQSGYLHSANRSLYIPSATTSEGFLAQRLSTDRFRIIDPGHDAMVTWTCPVFATAP
ncbi:hypothetical protein [Rosenbergiella nectarea]|uniref:hypothetical protein n=2 Tax=Rosenbergiella nectarea TaxID=988801 RepID=UPI001F4DCE86|nr:hypothetical protein [Rosenbergiella nectarea]